MSSCPWSPKFIRYIYPNQRKKRLQLTDEGKTIGTRKPALFRGRASRCTGIVELLLDEKHFLYLRENSCRIICSDRLDAIEIEATCNVTCIPRYRLITRILNIINQSAHYLTEGIIDRQGNVRRHRQIVAQNRHGVERIGIVLMERECRRQGDLFCYFRSIS